MSRPSVVILGTLLGTLAVAVTPTDGRSADRPPWLDRAIAHTLAHDFPEHQADPHRHDRLPAEGRGDLVVRATGGQCLDLASLG